MALIEWEKNQIKPLFKEFDKEKKGIEKAQLVKIVERLKEDECIIGKIPYVAEENVEALFEAVNKYEVKDLNLNRNQLGDAGAEAIAAMLRTNRSLTKLVLRDNKIGNAGNKALREAVEGREGFELEFGA